MLKPKNVFMKLFVKNIIKKFGFEIHRLRPISDPNFQILQGLNKFRIDLIFDIGANTGQFAQGLRAAGYSKSIVSFEPLADAHTQLCLNAQTDKNWKVHDRGAIGDFNGEIQINVAANSMSSSLLPMLSAHSSAAPESTYIGSESAPIRTLDAVASYYISESANLFVKVDTQGFEWQVLDGGSETLKNARGLMLELSLVPLYEGQRLWREIVDRLESAGFELWAIHQGFTDQRDGRMLQVDAVFFRSNKY